MVQEVAAKETLMGGHPVVPTEVGPEDLLLMGAEEEVEEAAIPLMDITVVGEVEGAESVLLGVVVLVVRVTLIPNISPIFIFKMVYRS